MGAPSRRGGGGGGLKRVAGLVPGSGAERPASNVSVIVSGVTWAAYRARIISGSSRADRESRIPSCGPTRRRRRAVRANARTLKQTVRRGNASEEQAEALRGMSQMQVHGMSRGTVQRVLANLANVRVNFGRAALDPSVFATLAFLLIQRFLALPRCGIRPSGVQLDFLLT